MNNQSLDAEKFYAHAFALYQAGRVQEASEVFRLLCTRLPLQPRFWFGLAASCQESGDYSNALHAWAMSALLDPSNPYPHFHAAECAHSRGDLSEALKALSEAKERLQTLSHPLSSSIELFEERWRSA